MRITQGTGQQQFLTAINALDESINQTQGQISANQSFTTASQNPIAAGEVNNYNQTLAQSQQFSTNATGVQANLNTEDSTLSQVQNQLNSLRSLVLEANSGTLTASNRQAIASQAQQIQNSLLTLANTQNGNGEYIFAGYAVQSQPFTLTAAGATYSGDSGVRQVEIAAGQTVANGDSGDTVFNQISTGNGTFTVAANSANTGTGLIGASTVSDPTQYDGGTYTIKFTAPDTYQVLNSANTVVSSGSYQDGTTISFDGLQVALSGAPATGDSFTVAPSTNQSLFSTVQNIVNVLNSGVTTTGGSSTALNNNLAGSINNIDQALAQMSDVRASVGGRLNAITAQQSVATTQQTQLQTSISNLQGLNYAQAITQLDQQNTTLQAALQAYTMTQGLSLFKYIQ
ncbi:MAG TPA: flagellar hook-associated protein FlgL [Steroidobacteraceae bacterium]|jgi:flagellar hook-associated protein 3 FlgL